MFMYVFVKVGIRKNLVLPQGAEPFLTNLSTKHLL